MANQYNNRVELSDGTVLIDLTSDTVAADKLLSGYTAHDKTGSLITGSVSFINVYTGTTDPPSSLGNDGDIYLKVAE